MLQVVVEYNLVTELANVLTICCLLAFSRVRPSGPTLLPRLPQSPASSLSPLPLGKPLFEMCRFHMGIAQMALDPPPRIQVRVVVSNSIVRMD